MTGLQCRCYRCRSIAPLPTTLLVAIFIVGNMALGVILTKLFSDM